MTDIEIEEGNRLIAVSVGLDIRAFKYILNDCKFHSSWDWFIPAYSAIVTHCSEDNQGHKFKLTEYVNDCICDDNIESAFRNLVEYINWYNANRDSKQG